jgi:hypothetical protein
MLEALGADCDVYRSNTVSLEKIADVPVLGISACDSFFGDTKI